MSTVFFWAVPKCAGFDSTFIQVSTFFFACFDLTIPKDKLEHKQVDSTFRQVSTVFFGAVPKCWKYHKTLRFFSTERANEGSSLAADHGRKFNSNRKWVDVEIWLKFWIGESDEEEENSNRKWVDVEYNWNFGLENQMKRKETQTGYNRSERMETPPNRV